MFRKVLIANRGEIALRVIRALREMEIASVAVYAKSDREALHVRKADEAVVIGSYLSIDEIIAAAQSTRAEAIHPGYGFLSENARFAAACEGARIKFIGPHAESIRKMGSKTEARKVAVASGVPIVPGTPDGLIDAQEALAVADRIGYPVMLKAVAGGGGKGMRRVDRGQDLVGLFETAAGEARNAFGDSAIYVEKLIERPRHVEIQVFGDEHGSLIHLGERECSIQRRHQKVIEESPSPLMAADPGLRDRMGAAAVRAAKAAGYYNAGTVEFLVDAERNFYFLEMNTRLQVEHPVTELVTGFDLVRWQLEVASGGALPARQEDVAWRGWAMECRVYAEDPENQFFPSPGKLLQYVEPAGPGVRVDGGVYPGWTVPLDYDPLLAKLAVWADTRERAAARLRRALGEYVVLGIRTNVEFFRDLMQDGEFLAGDLDTGFLQRYFERRPEREEDNGHQAIAEAVWKRARKTEQPETGARMSGWKAAGRMETLR